MVLSAQENSHYFQTKHACDLHHTHNVGVVLVAPLLYASSPDGVHTPGMEGLLCVHAPMDTKKTLQVHGTQRRPSRCMDTKKTLQVHGTQRRPSKCMDTKKTLQVHGAQRRPSRCMDTKNPLQVHGTQRRPSRCMDTNKTLQVQSIFTPFI